MGLFRNPDEFRTDDIQTVCQLLEEAKQHAVAETLKASLTNLDSPQGHNRPTEFRWVRIDLDLKNAASIVDTLGSEEVRLVGPSGTKSAIVTSGMLNAWQDYIDYKQS